MACHVYRDKRIHMIVCLPNMYEYKGYLFELHPGSGPIPLKKDWEPAKRAKRGFWDTVTEFCNMEKKEQKKYLVHS